MSARIAGEGLADTNVSTDLARIARSAVRQATSSVRDPSLVFAFVSAANPRATDHTALLKVAYELRAQSPDSVLVVADAPGVLAGAVERESTPAVSVLALDASAMRPHLTTLATDAARATHTRAVFEGLSVVPEGARSARLGVAILAPETHTTEAITGLIRKPLPPVVGAGTALVVAAQPRREPLACGAALLTVATSLGVTTLASPASRLVTPWMKVDAMEASLILRVDGRPMLDVVTEHGGGASPSDALLIALRGPDDASPPLLRAIAGVDAARGAVAVGDVLPRDAQIALAVRDPEAARQDLSTRLAAMARGLGGGTAAAALLFTCAGRGARFFRRADVDAGLVRARFPSLPTAGMQSAFELSPWGGPTRIHLYAAACTLFYRPS